MHVTAGAWRDQNNGPESAPGCSVENRLTGAGGDVERSVMWSQ